MNRYLLQSVGLLLALVVSVGLFNLWADPYSIYRFHSADSDRLSRLDQVYTMRLSKPWQVARVKPSAVVIGSSRAAPIRPSHPSWAGDRGFNLSMPGMSLYEIKRLLEHAHAESPLDKIVLGLEFASFLSDWSGGGLGFAEDRLRGGAQEDGYKQGVQLLRDMRDTLFTASAFSHSVRALDPDNRPPLQFYPDGSWENHSSVWLGRPGFVFVGRELLKRQDASDEEMEHNLRQFADILSWCHEQGIDARLFISPEHLFLVDLRARAGYSGRWIAFHHQLTRLNHEVAARYDRVPFLLQGFNHLPDVVNESLPVGVGSLSNWFRDGIHYHSRLGAVIVNSLWGDGPGYTLTSDTVATYLEKVDKMTGEYIRHDEQTVASYRAGVLGDELTGVTAR